MTGVGWRRPAEKGKEKGTEEREATEAKDFSRA